MTVADKRPETTMEEIKNVRQNLQSSKLKDVLLDEMGKHCPGMSYDKLLQAAMSLERARNTLKNVSLDADYQEMGRQFRLNMGRRMEEAKNTIQNAVREHRLCGRLNYQWYYEQPLTYWEKDFPYIKQLSDYLLANPVPERTSCQIRSYEIFQDDLVLGEQPELLEHLGLTMEQLNIIAQPDPLMLAVQSGKPPRGGWCQHFAVETKEAYYGLYPALNKTGFASIIYGAGWKLTGNLFQLPYQIGREWYRHRVWYFGNLDYEGIKIWHSLKQKLPVGMELKLALPLYKALLLYSPVKVKNKVEAEDLEAVDSFCQEFEADDAAIWRDILSKGFYYPQSILGNQELQKLFRELDKSLNK